MLSVANKTDIFVLFVFGFLCFLGTIQAMRLQAVGVRGRLLCGHAPASGVHVKLWEEDTGPDPDDVLDDKYTDASGSFHLMGSTRELTNIDPPGKRKVKLRIPSQYITSGSGVARRIFDVGILNLETIFPKEERDLL